MSEKEWQRQVVDLATTVGFARYHTYRSSKSPAGFPDEVLWRDRVIFVELKTEKGKPSARQREILDGLARAGAETYLWVPSDLDEIGRILSSRWRFGGGRLANAGGDWRPASLWIAGTGRSDST